MGPAVVGLGHEAFLGRYALVTVLVSVMLAWALSMMFGGVVDTSRVDSEKFAPDGVPRSPEIRVTVALTGTTTRLAPPALAVTRVPVTGDVSWAVSVAAQLDVKGVAPQVPVLYSYVYRSLLLVALAPLPLFTVMSYVEP